MRLHIIIIGVEARSGVHGGDIGDENQIHIVDVDQIHIIIDGTLKPDGCLRDVGGVMMGSLKKLI